MRRFVTLNLMLAALLLGPGRAHPAEDLVSRTLITGESAAAAQRLHAARKAVAEGRLDDALAEYLGLQDEAGDKLVLLNARDHAGDGPLVSVPVRRACQRDLAALPAEGVKLYRPRIEGQAQKWLDQGLAERDPALLQRVVEEALASRAAEKALDVLGDLAFERGRFDEADHWWGQLLLLPDRPLDAARIQARQLLARACGGEPVERLKAELAAFRARHGQAEGALAGRRGVYADIIQALLDRPEELAAPPGPPAWTTFAGDGSRTGVVSLDDAAGRLARMCRQEPRRFRLDTGERRDEEPDPLARPAGTAVVSVPILARSFRYHPVIVGPRGAPKVLLADARRVVAYDPIAGRSEVWFDLADLDTKAAQAARITPDARYTLTTIEGQVVARMGRTIIGPDQEGPSYLVCLAVEPGPDGKRLCWTVKAPEGPDAAVFEGAPLMQDGRLHVAVTSFRDGRAIAAIHCYSTRTAPPKLVWQQEVCQSAGQKAREDRDRHHLLTRAGSRIVSCSCSGAVVALEAATGQRCWAVRYPLAGEARSSWPRDVVPAVFAGGRVYVAPADGDAVLALDVFTGQVLWTRGGVEVVHLLGVAAGRLVAATPRGLHALDAANGRDRGGWVQPADGSEVWPLGRGLLAGDLVVWPLHDRQRGRVVAVRLEDGEVPEDLPPGRLRRVRPGNLALGDGCLAVATADTLEVFLDPALPVLAPGR